MPTSARSTTWASERTCVAAKQKKENKKQGQEANKHPCHLASRKKGLGRGKRPGESQKRAGPRMAPREKRQEAGRTAKKGDEPSAVGQKREQEQQTQVRAGVSCYFLVFVSQKKTNRNTNNVGEKSKEERTNPETADLTSREFFQTVSGATRQNIKPKPKQNTTEKHKTNTDTQKQKFAPVSFSNSDPKKRRTAKTAKDAQPDTKNTK